MYSDIRFPQGLDVEWQPAESVNLEAGTLKQWLLNTGSLTDRLQAQCQHFSLQKIGQGNAPLLAQELDNLSNPSEVQYDVREVVLLGDGQPWVYARSVIPQALTEAALKALGTTPLGKFLFNDSRFERSSFELCCIEPHQSINHIIDKPTQALWGRRSRFYYQQFCMSVAEVFLPGSPAYAG